MLKKSINKFINKIKRSMLMNKKLKTNEGLFLHSDTPTSKDKLGTHESIAKTLYKIISTNNNKEGSIRKPFVIGLFGKWGCGKSSIIKMLKKIG